MALLTVHSGYDPDLVDIVRDLGDGSVVVRFRSHGCELTTPVEYLSAEPGEQPIARPRPAGRLNTQQYAVLSALARAGSFGMTDDEHEGVNSLRSDSAGVRRKALERYGYVRDTGDQRVTRRGKRATIWQITFEGEAALRLHEMDRTG